MADSKTVNPIRAYRLTKKPRLSLAKLAARLGMSAPNLLRIETGKQKVSDDLLPKLVEATGLPADHFRPDLAKLFISTARRPGVSGKGRRRPPRAA